MLPSAVPDAPESILPRTGVRAALRRAATILDLLGKRSCQIRRIMPRVNQNARVFLTIVSKFHQNSSQTRIIWRCSELSVGAGTETAPVREARIL